MIELLDYTERTNAVDHSFFYNIHIETEAAKIGIKKRKENSCPFCYNMLELVVHIQSREVFQDLDIVTQRLAISRKVDINAPFFNDIIAYSCKHCGWWRVENRQSLFRTVDYILPTLRKYNIDAKNLPLGIIWTELLKKPDILYSVNSSIFEKFVGSVLSSVFNVNVYHIGKTGDGGIDLFYCQGDESFAVQVKRRTKKDSTEGVSLIREFIGALLLSDMRNGKIITTADRFTKGAIDASDSAMEKGIINQFDLVDKNEFLSQFKFNPKRANYPWEYVFYDVATTTEWAPKYKVILNKSTILNKV